jgi:hypothetical protein
VLALSSHLVPLRMRVWSILIIVACAALQCRASVRSRRPPTNDEGLTRYRASPIFVYGHRVPAVPHYDATRRPRHVKVHFCFLYSGERERQSLSPSRNKVTPLACPVLFCRMTTLALPVQCHQLDRRESVKVLHLHLHLRRRVLLGLNPQGGCSAQEVACRMLAAAPLLREPLLF